MSDFATRTTTPPSAVPLRLMRCIWRQGALTPRCPEEPRLDGKVALVTGGNAGIGKEVSRGLSRRGAEVIIAARNAETSARTAEEIARQTQGMVRPLPLDLARPDSVRAAVGALAGRPLDIVVANAGVWPKTPATSAHGHEIAFATNTLGHFLLVRSLLEQKLLAERARVVVVTGDIYIRQSECTPNFGGPGDLAYCRSKLGNLWFVSELARRFPLLEVCAVHPGVVASNLGGEATGFSRWMRNQMLIDCEQGAQTPLWAATQPIERGAYLHNTMGRIHHPPGDPAADAAKGKALWEQLEALSASQA